MSHPLDPRNILSAPWVYALMTRILGGNGRETFVTRELAPQPGERILDIGCGPGDMLDYLPRSCRYVGIDSHPPYIAAARKKYGDRAATFDCCPVEAFDPAGLEPFDLVVACCVVHHLDDMAADRLFAHGRRLLKPGGRLIALDPCHAPGQSRFVRFMLDHDRGRHVRDEAGYRRLAAARFPQVATRLDHTLMRIPYTHVIVRCTLSPSEASR